MYVFRQRHAATSDVIDGSWWNENQNEIGGMFNGGLDRDNLPPLAIDGPMLVNGACVNVDMRSTSTPQAAVMTSTTWQVLDSYDLTPDTDVLVEVDFSGTWNWTGAYSRVASSDGTTYAVDTVAVRVTVNGVTVCESGPSEDRFNEDCVAILGNLPLAAGAYTVQVEYMVAQRNYYDLSIQGTCTNTLDFNERTLLTIERRR